MVAVNVPANVPEALGIPLITPATLCRPSPGGRALAGTLNVGAGVPLAVTPKE